MEWRKSSYSESNGCVEVAASAGGVAVRDSKNPHGPVLSFTLAEWAAFLAGIRSGEFDDAANQQRPKPEVTRGQLAQAAGCDPTNPCHFDCCRAWGEDLDEWETLSEKDQQQILDLAEWVYRQTWI